jgi:hypothetical protein
MPLKDGVPHCINHPDVALLKNAELNAVTGVKVEQDDVIFVGERGVVVQLFACPECGYVELYWQKELARKFQRIAEERAKAKEAAAGAGTGGKQIAAKAETETR